MPERPWCSNHSHGRYPRVLPKADARRCRYIQPQPPWVRVWLNFDYDRDDAWCAADEVELPAPTLTVINPENGHGHLVYGLAVPVLPRAREQRQAEALPRSDRTRHGSAARCRPELSRAHLQEPVPSVLGDAVERPCLHAVGVARVARRSQRLPATEGAGHRRGAERRDVRGREAMGIPGRPGAQGGPAVRWTPGGTNASAMRRHSRLRGTCRHWTVRSVDGLDVAWADGPGNESPKNGSQTGRRPVVVPAERAAGRPRRSATGAFWISRIPG